MNGVKESEVAKTQAYILFYHRRKESASSNEETCVANRNSSKDAGDSDSSSFLLESIVTYTEASPNQDDNFHNNSNANSVLNKDGYALPSLSGCSSANSEIYLEDVLD